VLEVDDEAVVAAEEGRGGKPSLQLTQGAAAPVRLPGLRVDERVVSGGLEEEDLPGAEVESVALAVVDGETDELWHGRSRAATRGHPV
jgi:hypothetical protein